MPGPIGIPPVGEIEVAALGAVASGTETTTARTLAGSVAAITATPLGAVGTTIGQNLGFSAVGSAATGSPEIPGLGWLTTWIFQLVKYLPFVRQDKWKTGLLLLIGFAVGALVWSLQSQGEYAISIARAATNAGLIATSAVTNYHSMRGTGVFGSAPD